jgi:Uma2 family endonuclease
VAVIVRRPPGSRTTIDEFLRLDEEVRRRHELIGGELEERGAASGRHGRAQSRVSSVLGPYDRRRGAPERPGGFLFATEIDIFFDEENVLRPDVAGWRRERLAEIPDEFPVRVLPDWTCEILSTNRRNDLIRKKRVYHQYRISHYWILDPEEGSLSVFRWNADGYTEVLSAERGERVRAEPFDGLEIAVGFLFGDDEEEDGSV